MSKERKVTVLDWDGKAQSPVGYGIDSIPYMDNTLLNSGLEDVLVITNECDSYRRMLCTEVDSFDSETIKAMLQCKKMAVDKETRDTVAKTDYKWFTDNPQPNEILVSCINDKTVFYSMLSDAMDPDDGESLPKEEFYAKNNLVVRIVSKNLEEWTAKGILVDNMEFIVLGDLATDYNNVKSARFYKGISRVEGFDGLETDDTYSVYYVMVILDEENPRTTGYLRYCGSSNDDLLQAICEKCGYDYEDDDVVDGIVEKLENTPLSTEITDKGYSDKQLKEWDRQRYAEKRGPFLR